MSDIESSAEPVRIGLCGLGSIGRAAGRLLLDHREGVEIVSAATLEPEAIGKPLHEVVGSGALTGPVIVGELNDMLTEQPQVVVYATGSFLDDTLDDILACVAAGASVVSPCEELAFPFERFEKAARRIDDAARDAGVTVLGTGINPGFIFDAMLATATGASWDITSIRGRRVVDVVGFGERIHRRLGIGYTSAEFDEGHASGKIHGHVGFPESIGMVCERLGVSLDEPVSEVFEQMIAQTAAPTSYGEVAAGRTEGFIQRATGRVGGEDWIQLELVLHLRPQEAGIEPTDSFQIDGIHPVHLTLSPGMDAIPATAAILVNSIPALLRSEPGLKSVKDLPASSAWIGDLRRDRLR